MCRVRYIALFFSPQGLLVISPTLLVEWSLPADVGEAGGEGWIPGSGRSPGVGNGNVLQYFCLENPRGAWRATVVHGMAKSQTPLSDGVKCVRARARARAHTHTLVEQIMLFKMGHLYNVLSYCADLCSFVDFISSFTDSSSCLPAKATHFQSV